MVTLLKLSADCTGGQIKCLVTLLKLSADCTGGQIKCLVTLYNKIEAVQDKNKQKSAENISHAIALAELLVYIDEARKDEIITVFKLADLCKLYSTRFEQLGGEQHDHLHSTRLKNRILAHFPDLTAHKEGHDILLAFNNDLG